MNYETIEYKGNVINIEYDQDAQSPSDWDNDFAFLVYDHRDFFVEVKGFDPDDIFEAMQDGKKTFDGHYFFPVFAYIHSGVALSLGRQIWPFTCGWDTSFKGFALVQRGKGTWTEDKAREVAQSVVNEWNEYLSGEVYGFVAETADGEHIDSCWGYYGEAGLKDAIDTAKGAIDWHISENRKTHFAQLKAWIKAKVPLIYRQPLQLSF